MSGRPAYGRRDGGGKPHATARRRWPGDAHAVDSGPREDVPGGGRGGSRTDRPAARGSRHHRRQDRRAPVAYAAARAGHPAGAHRPGGGGDRAVPRQPAVRGGGRADGDCRVPRARRDAGLRVRRDRQQHGRRPAQAVGALAARLPRARHRHHHLDPVRPHRPHRRDGRLRRGGHRRARPRLRDLGRRDRARRRPPQCGRLGDRPATPRGRGPRPREPGRRGRGRDGRVRGAPRTAAGRGACRGGGGAPEAAPAPRRRRRVERATLPPPEGGS